MLQLISEIADAHVLYKKCVVATPKPIDDAIRRKFLLEESIEPNEAPGRPTIDCFVSLLLSLECQFDYKMVVILFSFKNSSGMPCKTADIRLLPGILLDEQQDD